MLYFDLPFQHTRTYFTADGVVGTYYYYSIKSTVVDIRKLWPLRSQSILGYLLIKSRQLDGVKGKQLIKQIWL